MPSPATVGGGTCMSTAAVFPRARLRRMLAACVFCVSAVGAVVDAQEPGGRILGSVQDLTGVPGLGAAGAWVTAQDVVGGMWGSVQFLTGGRGLGARVTASGGADRAVRADEGG